MEWVRDAYREDTRRICHYLLSTTASSRRQISDSRSGGEVNTVDLYMKIRKTHSVRVCFSYLSGALYINLIFPL